MTDSDTIRKQLAIASDEWDGKQGSMTDEEFLFVSQTKNEAR